VSRRTLATVDLGPESKDGKTRLCVVCGKVRLHRPLTWNGRDLYWVCAVPCAGIRLG
jgi:hypothetical protein